MRTHTLPACLLVLSDSCDAKVVNNCCNGPSVVVDGAVGSNDTLAIGNQGLRCRLSLV